MSIKQAAFFFGSGISYDSGLPKVIEITHELLEGAWRPHTNLHFYPARPEDGAHSVGEAKTAQDFLRIVNENIDDNVTGRESRQTNYEDIYSAIRQIVLDEKGEQPNPLIRHAVVRIKNATAHLWANTRRVVDHNRFASLADRSTDLIQWVVYHKLSKYKSISGLDLIPQVAKAVNTLDIFTLNHDLLVEDCLNQANVSFADGFGQRRNNVVVFNWSWNVKGQSVYLLKLHGSINWYLFNFDTFRQYAKVIESKDFSRDENGNIITPIGSTPMFLTGTGTKETAYGTGLIGEIFNEMRSRLSKHATLICSGYGWGDKGINVRINQWLLDRPENRVVILHGGPEIELYSKRFWYFRWERYIKAGKVIVIPKWLSACTIEDLQPYFDVIGD